MFQHAFLVLFIGCAHGEVVDTSKWLGAEYTPARASNTLWWWNFDEYEDDVLLELEAARRHFGYTTLRMFLHPLLYEADDVAFISNITRFVEIAETKDMRVGFVFFDDCFAHEGADLNEPCLPSRDPVQSGCEVGSFGQSQCCMNCWVASPQDKDRDPSDVDRYRPYVTTIVSAFKNDPRVLWWEIFNEPNEASSFSLTLRSAAYSWAKAVHPTQPVISCWDDNDATDIIDHHSYSGNFIEMSKATYSDPLKSAFITESGCRWYRTLDKDAGSPLNVVNWLNFLLEERKRRRSAVPFVPGVMFAWELMVGNVNTRFQWEDPAGLTPEPPIPWCGSLFPDGTPVSYTEAAIIREYITLQMNTSHRASETKGAVTYVDTFLSKEQVLQNDQWLDLTASAARYTPPGVGPVQDALLEVSLWPTSVVAGATVMLRASVQDGEGCRGYNVTVSKSRIVVWRQNPERGGRVELGSVKIAARGGLFTNAWNLLRIHIENSTVRVWLNPQYQDTKRVVDGRHFKTIRAMLSGNTAASTASLVAAR
ncbi:hypothetical protein CYMTET_53699 [Cymbomonas tetramitiformis]|uniref:Glycoside hydrolase family 5 domain-containing protein n=1 Tax=Cymbomonas tetramitiformis TaxID=36881 RepID=A0AAE0EPT4_9CHLO|nr:hypothetical protein CYMTET_53699 [Cymbomonas tetramitiformis]|eukprot:gene12203-14414_t